MSGLSVVAAPAMATLSLLTNGVVFTGERIKRLDVAVHWRT